MSANADRLPGMDKTLSERLAEWRDAQGWTLAEAGVHLGVAPSSVYAWEKGGEPKNKWVRARIERVLAAWERANVSAD